MVARDRRHTLGFAAGLVACLAIATVPNAGTASIRQLQPKPTRVAPVPTATPTPIPPGNIRVEITLLRRGKRLPGDDSVAWMDDMRANFASGARLKIAQRKKQFEPRVSIVSTGSTVDFPNYDRVFHNVFSLSTPKSFDLGLYRKGKSKSVRFDNPGLVQVYCNIHPHMAAFLMVVDSARHSAADSQGIITLRGIPPGPQKIQGWNSRGGMWARNVTVRPGRTTPVSVRLDISSWREVPHLNKHGKEYPPPDDDDFRY
jgi:plastocyanin